MRMATFVGPPTSFSIGASVCAGGPAAVSASFPTRAAPGQKLLVPLPHLAPATTSPELGNLPRQDKKHGEAPEKGGDGGVAARQLQQKDGQEERPGEEAKAVGCPLKGRSAAGDKGRGVGGQPGIELEQHHEQAAAGERGGRSVRSARGAEQAELRRAPAQQLRQARGAEAGGGEVRRPEDDNVGEAGREAACGGAAAAQ